MKNKILTFVIGLLVGAILATGGFLIYEQTKSSDSETSMNKFEGRPQMRGGENFDGETPPDMDNSDSSSRPQRPDRDNSETTEKPSNDNNTNTSTEENS